MLCFSPNFLLSFSSLGIAEEVEEGVEGKVEGLVVSEGTLEDEDIFSTGTALDLSAGTLGWGGCL